MKATLAAIPQFVRYLSTFPPPQSVVDALAYGPLARLDAVSAILWGLREGPSRLVTLGSVGLSEQEAARYGVIPMQVDLPVTRALSTRSVIRVPVAQFGPDFIAGLDEQFVDEIFTRLGPVELVSVPILHANRPVGGLGFLTAGEWEQMPQAADALDAVSAVLGLWMTHPRAGLSNVAPPATRGWSLAFTSRQREVLRRVEAGQPTPRMAAELGVSESSVKADLQGAMRALRTSDRREAADRARLLGLL